MRKMTKEKIQKIDKAQGLKDEMVRASCSQALKDTIGRLGNYLGVKEAEVLRYAAFELIRIHGLKIRKNPDDHKEEDW